MRNEENRFKLARTKYNQHGSQSTTVVWKATGASKSLIEDLESNVGKPRDTGYLKTPILAKHYGVSTDYLAGLSEVPVVDINLRTICEYTGLSSKAINLLHDYDCKGNQEEKKPIAFINRILSAPHKSPGYATVGATLFSWMEEYVNSNDVQASKYAPFYKNAMNSITAFLNVLFSVLQETNMVRQDRRFRSPIESAVLHFHESHCRR